MLLKYHLMFGWIMFLAGVLATAVVFTPLTCAQFILSWGLRNLKEKDRDLSSINSPTPSRILNFQLIDPLVHLGSMDDVLWALFVERARAFGRAHQRATSKRPVCNYRHEAWPCGRTIGPLFISLSFARRDGISDLCAFGPSVIPSTRHGISISYRSPIRRF